MPYTPELFNRYNELVDKSRNAVCRHIQYLLKPNDGYPKGTDARLKELYSIWQADCRAMDAACEEYVHLNARNEMIEMPIDDDEHFLCRRMAAVVIERNIYGEHEAEFYLPKLIEAIKASKCHTHSSSCACHMLKGWTYANQELINGLGSHYLEKKNEVEREARLAEPAYPDGPSIYRSNVRLGCAGWRDCTCGGCSGGGPGGGRAPGNALPPLRRSDEHVVNCACGSCYNKRVANGTQEAYMASLHADVDKVLERMDFYGSTGKTPRAPSASIAGILSAAAEADDAISAAKKMPGGSTEDGFVKNLFKTVQGVEFDSKCPHSLPFYACMSCSH